MAFTFSHEISTHGRVPLNESTLLSAERSRLWIENVARSLDNAVHSKCRSLEKRRSIENVRVNPTYKNCKPCYNNIIIIIYDFKEDKKMKVSFIGLGVMGFPMAGHLANKNSYLKLKVYNRSIKKSEDWISKFDGIISHSAAEAAHFGSILAQDRASQAFIDTVLCRSFGRFGSSYFSGSVALYS